MYIVWNAKTQSIINFEVRFFLANDSFVSVDMNNNYIFMKLCNYQH